jgi:hypothetical protein
VIDVSGAAKSLVTFPLFQYLSLLFFFDLLIDILKLSLHFRNLRGKFIDLSLTIEPESFFFFYKLPLV